MIFEKLQQIVTLQSIFLPANSNCIIFHNRQRKTQKNISPLKADCWIKSIWLCDRSKVMSCKRPSNAFVLTFLIWFSDRFNMKRMGILPKAPLPNDVRLFFWKKNYTIKNIVRAYTNYFKFHYLYKIIPTI